MPSLSRESSRDRELVLRHQPSFSDSGRSSVPMWDSSDPDRAPPPLPLNPGTSSPVTKPNVGANISAAAEAIVARAREHYYAANNSMPNKSPEKSLIKGQYHKRMQSLQTGAVKDLSSYLENPRSPEKSPDRATRRSYDYENKSPERNPARSSTPTPTSRDTAKEFSSPRPSTRPALKAILGETPPQSATMRALQGTPSHENDRSLSDITNDSKALVRTPQAMEAISNQILGLTGIATRLQQEMAALSRRSKDNATDLISLKEATHSRDEDIRTSLRDLVANLSVKLPGSDTAGGTRGQLGRSPASYLLQDKSSVSPSLPKSVSLPRIPSPASFAASLDRDIANSPNPYAVDGGASIALLEKILREMGTREGQERLLSTISELSTKSATSMPDSRIAKQLEEVVQLLKENMSSRALVRITEGSGLDSTPTETRYMGVAKSLNNTSTYGQPTTPVALDSRKAYASPRAADFVSDDILKLLRRMKDSIAEGGGMSAEIKALVRELRGEVLGMGREIGRKLDQLDSVQGRAPSHQDTHGPGAEEVSRIVQEGLLELKTHLDRVMKDRRRQSSSSTVSRSTVDGQEIYAAVKNALGELSIPQQIAVQQRGSGIEREEILEAVREAWETYKPEIELQNFGLERDEILQCLKEGLEDYKPAGQQKSIAGYDEVLDAVREGLKDFTPPPVDSEASITKEEILMSVRECLESFEFPGPTQSHPQDYDSIRDEVLEAVKDGLSAQPTLSKEIEFNREDLFDAVKASMEAAPVPIGDVGVQVLEKMQDLIDGMRGEFQQYSAASGRDTEQVLDAMKDGLEVLRASIETYVDRASDVTGKDEIIDTVRDGLNNLRIDLEASIANAPRPDNPTSTGELLDAMEKEFEHLRSTISSSVTRGDGSDSGREELLDAIRDGFDEIRDEIPTGQSRSDPEALAFLKEELQHLRETLATTLTRGDGSLDREEVLDTIREGIDKAQLGLQKNNGRPESILSHSSELLDIFNESLETLKADVERIVNKPVDMTIHYEILDALKDGLAGLRTDIDSLRAQQAEVENSGAKRGREVVVADEEATRGLKAPDLENLEVMITQLKIKVESLDPTQGPTSSASEPTGLKTDFERLETLLKETQGTVTAILEREQSQQENLVSKEDIDAIETLLRNTKATVEETSLQEPETIARVEHLDNIEALLKSTRDAVDEIGIKYDSEGASKTDVGAVAILLKDLQGNLQDMMDKATDEAVTKTDIEALATLCSEGPNQLKDMLSEGEILATKADMDELQDVLKEFQEKADADARLAAQAFDARKTEHGGLADKIEDAKMFFESVRAELKASIETNGEGIEGLNTALSAIGEAVTSGASSETFKELRETVAQGFDKVHANHEAARADMDLQSDFLVGKHDDCRASIIEDVTSKIDARFDELMTKYDDAQAAAEVKASAFASKGTEQEEAVAGARAVAEDLKILIDTLGTTVTDSCERTSEDSRAVFTKVEEIGSKVDETMQLLSNDGKADHQLTRAEISKTLIAVESLQAHASDFNPKIMNAISDILSIVGQHYDEAQRSSEEIKLSVNAIPSSIPIPALPAPQDHMERETVVSDMYDDTEVHSKLDKLVEYATEAGKSAVQFELLEQIKVQVEDTASEFQSFMNAQQATIMDMQENRAREAEEVAIAIERRTAQKEVVETDIVRLSDERKDLVSSVQDLKREEKNLSSLKAKLQADVSSLETALQIRREEMQVMEARAEGLERRILEGVLDHSRSLLISSRPQSSLKSMNLKRVASSTSSTATVTTGKGSSVNKPMTSTAGNAVSSAVGMALKKRQPTRAAVDGVPSTARSNRRILSLSTIGANKGAGPEKSIILANNSISTNKGITAFAGGGMKRSHSVKSNFPVRKTSWGGTKKAGMLPDTADEDDKENSVLEEEDEDVGNGSERRTSYTGTYTGTEESYCTRSVTDSTDDRRTSYAPSMSGALGAESISGDDRGEHDDGSVDGSESLRADTEVSGSQDVQLYQGRDDPREGFGRERDLILYGMPTDSGLGSDLPTAALEAGSDFFGKQ